MQKYLMGAFSLDVDGQEQGQQQQLHRLIPTNGVTKQMHVQLQCLLDTYFAISAQQHGIMTGRGSNRGSHTSWST
jgi:hypothetical protein